jgi:hypothetical protein
MREDETLRSLTGQFLIEIEYQWFMDPIEIAKQTKSTAESGDDGSEGSV